MPSAPSAPREREPYRDRERDRSDRSDSDRAPRNEPRGARTFRPAPVARDPFFDKPYETPSEAAPAWEATKAPVRSSISANIKPKRKVAALFKAEQVQPAEQAEPTEQTESQSS